jgi:3-phenylpropionate/cinnamic acid dioxygenase small subunit
MSADSRDIEQFLFREAQLLDEARFEEWLKLFTDTAWYWVPVSPDQPDPFEMVSIIYDDRRLLETRVRRLLNANIHAEEPRTRTSRIVGNIIAEDEPADDAADGADIVVSSRFQMAEFRRDRQRIFAGSLRHGLVTGGEGFRIAWKRVDLVNCDGMLDGITVPF